MESARTSLKTENISFGKIRESEINVTFRLEDITFRKLRESDIDEALSLETENFSKPWPRHAFEEAIPKEDLDYFVAVDSDGSIIGTAAMYYIAGEEGDLMNVSVDKRYRNQGICSRMVDYVIEQGKAAGLSDFTLEVRAGNTAAIRVYEKNGFRTEGVRKGYYEDPKEDALIMWKR